MGRLTHNPRHGLLIVTLLLVTLVFVSGDVLASTAFRGSTIGDRILIATGGQLILVDVASKTVLWKTSELHGALSVAAMPNGEFLVSEGRSIARIDKDGKLIARNEKKFLMVIDVKPLGNDHMLVADGRAGTVVEMDWDGNVYWSVGRLHWPSEAIRLDNGNTLVADGTSAVKEFDSTGALRLRIPLRQWAGAIERLPDGSTLIGESASFELVSSSSNPLWRVSGSSRVTGVHQISDNRYLIVQPDAGSVAITDSQGRIEWELTGLRLPWRAIYIP